MYIILVVVGLVLSACNEQEDNTREMSSSSEIAHEATRSLVVTTESLTDTTSTDAVLTESETKSKVWERPEDAVYYFRSPDELVYIRDVTINKETGNVSFELNYITTKIVHRNLGQPLDIHFGISLSRSKWFLPDAKPYSQADSAKSKVIYNDDEIIFQTRLVVDSIFQSFPVKKWSDLGSIWVTTEVRPKTWAHG
jgi:hypothetical protein